MKKEITIQRAWLEGLVETAAKAAKEEEKLVVKNMSLYELFGYIKSAEHILERDALTNVIE